MSIRSLERLQTGIDELDRALGGGIPTRSTTIFAGPSGTGKTLLALQTVFHAARGGATALYLPTLSEPPSKLLRFMQLYDFFDEELAESRVRVRDLGSELRSRGAKAGLAQLIAHVEAEAPDIVIIDSFKAIHDLTDPGFARQLVYDLAVSMAAWGATTILVGEYGVEELRDLPESAVADGIIQFHSAIDELTLVRELEIHKLRGSSYATGVHFYELSYQGMSFYPRVRGPEVPDPAPRERNELVRSGVEGLDELFFGGIPAGSSTVIEGPTGTGKTILGLTFAARGAERGEPAVVLGFEETPAQLRATARGLDVDIDALERTGRLSIFYNSPVELSPDRFLHEALEVIDARRAQRVLLDSLTTLELGAISRRRFKELVYALVKHLRARGVTVMMPKELVDGPGGSGLSFAADNVIVLSRTSDAEGRSGRWIAVLKARGSPHREEARELHIGRGGAQIGSLAERRPDAPPRGDSTPR